MKNEKYILYFDLEDSRLIKNRKILKQNLDILLNYININYAKQLYRPATIIKGIDEFEIILNNKKALLNIIQKTNEIMYPNKYRLVLVQGKIDIISKKASEMDGNAFHNIADLLAYIKKNQLYFISETKNKIVDLALNSSVNLLLNTWYNWTYLQFTIFNMLKSGFSQIEIAQKMEKTPQVISKISTTIKWKQMKWIEEKIQQFLNE